MQNKTLKIDDLYSIEMNTNEFYLKYEETYIDKDGKEKTRRDGWSYPKLVMCLRKYNEQQQKQETFQGVLEAIERVEIKINTLYGNL